VLEVGFAPAHLVASQEASQLGYLSLTKTNKDVPAKFYL